MTFRTKLTLWYVAAVMISLSILGGFVYYEFVAEPRLAESRGMQRESSWEEVGEVLLFGALPCLLLAFASAWWFTERAFAPLRKLTAAAENMRDGNLKQQLASDGSGDEIDRLTNVFNAMTERLDDSFQRVRQFTLHASHELKTPLTIMRSEVETTLQTPGIGREEHERASSLLDEIERLTHIVDALTFLTKADSGQLKLSRVSVRLDDLVREACADAQVLASQKQIQVDIGHCDAAAILADRHRLRQLLLILTDNAVKYNHPGGTVFLDVTATGDTVALRVSNTGPGLSAEEMRGVFDRFFRGAAAQKQHLEGSGLGLSIAKSIVDAHRAHIDISSRAEGLTTVTVRFSAVRDDDIASAPALAA